MLINKIKKDRLVARKNNDTDVYNALTTLLSDIQRLEKNQQENDDSVQKIIIKSIKSLKEMINVTTGAQKENNEKELNILSIYLPKQLTSDELHVIIENYINELNVTSPKGMGKVMGQLAKNYKGQYDGKLASMIVKEKLI